MLQEYGIEFFLLGVSPHQKDSYISKVQKIEEDIVHKVFKGHLYEETIYEYMKSFCNEKTVSFLVELITKAKIPSGTSFQKIYHSCQNYISSRQNEVQKGITAAPVISLDIQN